MDLPTLLLIATGLAMDCFAVALAVGTRKGIPRIRYAAMLALVFGGFQSLMNIIGWAAGVSLLPYISGFDHWIAFILLAGIGGKMIYEGIGGGERQEWDRMQAGTLLVLAVATSIDSLGVGLSFALLAADIVIPALIIGAVSALFASNGVLLGNRLAERFGERMEILGGVILIGIGLRILLEHLSA
jgi:Predicted membrane protein